MLNNQLSKSLQQLKAAALIEQANKSANQLIEEAKAQAEVEGERIRQQARESIDLESIKHVKVYAVKCLSLQY